MITKKHSHSGLSWLPWLLPALLFYVLFMTWPLLDTLRLSLYTGSAGFDRTFAGLDNFRRLFTDEILTERFRGAFAQTAIFFLIHMLVQNCLGIFLAVLLTNSKMKGRAFYQTIIFLPVTLAVLSIGYLWKLLLDPVWSGPFFQFLGLDFLVHPWLGDKRTALLAVSLVSCWQWIGIPVMIFAAALQGINEDYIEAAYIEGASKAQIFWRIKLPLIKPMVGMVAILTFVNSLNAFDIVFSMTNVHGAPDYSTDLIGTLFYRIGFAGIDPGGIPDPGMGAAIAAITFLVLCLAVIPMLSFTQRRD